MVGIVRGYEVGKNRNGKHNVLLLKCEISSPQDIQTVEYMTNAGVNTIPVEGSVVKILDAGKGWKIAIASNDKNDFDDTLNEGEYYLYNKSKSSFIKILNNDKIQINGDADNLVSFADLNTSLQSFASAINANLALKLDGAGAAGTVTIDISASRVNSIEVP